MGGLCQVALCSHRSWGCNSMDITCTTKKKHTLWWDLAKSVCCDAASLHLPLMQHPAFLLLPSFTFTICSHILLFSGLSLLCIFSLLFFLSFFFPLIMLNYTRETEDKNIQNNRAIEIIPRPVLLASSLQIRQKRSSQIRSVCEVSITFFQLFTLLILKPLHSIISCVSFTQARCSGADSFILIKVSPPDIFPCLGWNRENEISTKHTHTNR